MLYCGTYEVENIRMHPNDAPHTSHYVYMTKDKDEPMFTVSCCCDGDWSWDFWYSKTNYEIVKHLIMDCVFDCDTMDELIDAMDEAFEEYCLEIIYNEAELQEEEFDIEFDGEVDVDIECDGDCENCNFKKD